MLGCYIKLLIGLNRVVTRQIASEQINKQFNVVYKQLMSKIVYNLQNLNNALNELQKSY